MIFNSIQQNLKGDKKKITITETNTTLTKSFLR